MLKKILLLAIFTFLLSSCFSWDESDIIESTSWLKLFENNNFSLNIPEKWEIIENKDNILPKPKFWKISLAVSSSDFIYWFSNNLLVLSQTLSKETSSKDYSMLNNIAWESEYLNYIKLDEKNIKFNSGEESNLYIFEAKYNKSTPKLKFLQTWLVCKDHRAYLLTIALNLDIASTSKYEDLLKTFSCKYKGL